MYEQYGGFTLGIVFAHEFGHAIQARAGVEGDTIMTELQADCFAGAWTGDVAAGNADYFALTLDDLDKAIAGFLDLRDSVGTGAEDPQAHGTGFDRIGAFSEGFEEGLDRCADYPDLFDAGELVVTESEFTDPEDYERGGNLPLEEAVSLAVDDLQQFWGVIFTELGQPAWDPVDDVVPMDPDTDEITCGDDTYSGDVLVNASFYCVPDDTIYVDAKNLVPSLYEVGDYAVATELARQFAYAAQVRLGNLENTLATNLQADCYAGVYAYSGFSGNRGDDQLLSLSPGDLDEAVIAFLLTSDSSAEAEDDDDATVGTAFQRFDAYRTGFLDGIDTCDEIAASASDE
jgi:predicted metalloprotease